LKVMTSKLECYVVFKEEITSLPRSGKSIVCC
jgi:hypothetical protein